MLSGDERGLSVSDWADEKARLREAREPLEKENAALHDLLAGCASRLNPEEFPEWCEEIGKALTCGQDGKPTPCTHYQQAIAQAYEQGRAEGREQGAREERAALARGIEEQFGTNCADYRDLLAFIASRGPMSEGGGK